MKPLMFCDNGETCTVKDIMGGKALNKRLIDLGMNKGTKVKIVRNEGGRLILSIEGTRIALGQGMAHKIMVISEENLAKAL
ncbi:MAG: ferrous iron transport protein A [Tissierellales bacterium]|jgi:ferrous iron transport protein A|nr:ferrous iron transport protein A [Tissierellales bacterium]HCX04220.1 ferrous iron transport protein A [Clostridiales bacterium]